MNCIAELIEMLEIYIEYRVTTWVICFVLLRCYAMFNSGLYKSFQPPAFRREISPYTQTPMSTGDLVLSSLCNTTISTLILKVLHHGNLPLWASPFALWTVSSFLSKAASFAAVALDPRLASESFATLLLVSFDAVEPASLTDSET